MRILWVKVGGLWPVNTGGRRRSFQIISELSRRHRVIVLTTDGPGDDPTQLAAQLPDCQRALSFPHAIPKHGSPRFAAALARSWLTRYPVDLWRYRVPALSREVRWLMAEGQVDLCVADFLFATPNVPLDGPVPVVFFAHNVEHMIWRRLRQIEMRRWKRPLLELEWRKMRCYEAKSCARAALTITVSDVDRAVLAEQAPGGRICTIPTGVDTAYFTPGESREAPSRLVFTGSMDWYPNEDAMLYFMGAILPLIRQDVPDVSLTVVGRNPSERLAAAASTIGIQVTGTVDDIRSYIDEAAVYVVPLRVGGGTRLKIFEALAMGKVVVSTTVGAEGLPLIPGKHFLQADDPSDFAKAVVSLLRDPHRRRALGMAGRRLVEERYAWPRVAAEFESRCREVVSNGLE
jgi:glycosyltransferase involved in cell wall biosynthesis